MKRWFGSDASSRDAAPTSGYRPFYGFPRALRIIVADDDKDTVVTLKAILDDEGHDVVGVHSGPEVLRELRDQRPDVVILDLAMPEMSGFEIAEEIRARFGPIHPMLIAISGLYNKRPDKILAQIAGFDHHLTKPCAPADIVALIAPLANPDCSR